MSKASKALLLVISGPAGSGKGTVVKMLREMIPTIGLSISATTRQPRPGEAEGVSYYYITRDEFESRIANGEILEHTTYCGNYYGTPKSEVDKNLAIGKDMILEIEVDGASQIKKVFPDAITIMLIPPDFDTLKKRLAGRGTETPEIIEKRLQRSKEELEISKTYDYVVVNHDGGIEKCAADICSIIDAEHSRPSRMDYIIEHFFD